jgi:hypothetical protein
MKATFVVCNTHLVNLQPIYIYKCSGFASSAALDLKQAATLIHNKQLQLPETSQNTPLCISHKHICRLIMLYEVKSVLLFSSYLISRVGQNRICTYIYSVYLVISKPKIPYVHRIYMVLANPTHFPSPRICSWGSRLSSTNVLLFSSYSRLSSTNVLLFSSYLISPHPASAVGAPDSPAPTSFYFHLTPDSPAPTSF